MAIFANLLLAGSLADIKNKGTVRIGVAENSPPFSRLTDGKFEGFEVDFAHELAKRIFGQKNGKVEFVGMTASQRIPALQENKVDLVVRSFSVTPERKKLVDFSTPYFSVDTSIMTKKEDKISSFGQLAGKNVLVTKGSAALSKLKKSNVNLVECDNVSHCYKMLKNNKGVAFCTDNTLLMAYTVIDPDFELGVKQYGRSDFIAVGVQKGNKELLQFVNAQIIKLSKEGFFKKAFEEQLNPFYKGTADKKYFLLDDLYNLLGTV